MQMSIYDYRFEKPVLETERLLLRELTAEDADDLKEWLGLPEIYTYWGRCANKNELSPEMMFVDPRPHVQRKPTLDLHLGILLKENGKVIGDLFGCQTENARMAKVAYRISPAYWGKGIATEALDALVRFYFTKTELQRLWTDVDTRNVASVRVLEKCGFVREGCIRQGKMVSTYCDYYLYGMLKEDFEACTRHNLSP